jgi:hypothetical protein
MVETYKAPLCPNCGEELLEVIWETSETWDFDAATGTYDCHKGSDSSEFKCGLCGYDVSDIIENPASYQGEEE